MNQTVYKVYWTLNNHANSQDFVSLTEALEWSKVLRNDKDNRFTFVTLVSENIDVVGKLGVDSVVDGKLPSGNTYTYTKRDALSQRMKNLTDEIEVPLDDE